MKIMAKDTINAQHLQYAENNPSLGIGEIFYDEEEEEEENKNSRNQEENKESPSIADENAEEDRISEDESMSERK